MRTGLTRNDLYIIIAGVGIGWLIGLSVSPVVSIVITSVTGSVAAIVAALSGVRLETDGTENAENQTRRPRWKVNAAPVAMLAIGLIAGSTAGIVFRTYDWLSPRTLTVSEEVAQWTSAGLQPEVVAKRLLESKNPLSDSSDATQLTDVSSPGTVLFTQEAQGACKTLTALVMKQDYEDLQTELRSSPVLPFRELPAIVTDTVKLAQIVEKVLCPDIQP
jgi:hypothetical protein